jgi:hypothetical protein
MGAGGYKIAGAAAGDALLPSLLLLPLLPHQFCLNFSYYLNIITYSMYI